MKNMNVTFPLIEDISMEVAKERMEVNEEDVICYDWFFCTKKTLFGASKYPA